MTDLDVPVPLPLSHLPSVELMRTGSWHASTGEHTITTSDLANAVAALECPAVRRPVLKLGHTDPRFDGEPAAGWLANMATTDDGHVLVADYVGMPGWLGPILASAYPDRSIEGAWDYECQLGHHHGFVLTGLALLGVSPPAIGTLTSLQDIGRMYGVELASGEATEGFTIELKGTNAMPQATTVAATVSTEDVRRAYYDDAPWELWIEEISLDPLQLIVVNDSNGDRMRIPIIIDTTQDGTDGVTFGDPVTVVVRYEDIETPEPAADETPAEGDQVAASAALHKTVRFASRTESRPGHSVEAATPAAAADGPTDEGGSGVEITNEQLAALRTALGLEDTADLDAIVAAVEALAESAAETDDTETVAAAAGSVVSIDREALAGLKREAKLGRMAHERQEREDREAVVNNAIAAGKIPQSRRDHWNTLMSADPKGTGAILASIADQTAVPTAEMGHSVTPEGTGQDNGWFNQTNSKGA